MNSPVPIGDTDLLHVYDSALRGVNEMENCVRVTRIGPVFAGEFASHPMGFVSYSSLDGLDGAALDALIDEVVAHFDATAVGAFEWKTRGHDAPDDLTARLAAKGFEPEDVETVMLGEARSVAETIDAGPASVPGLVLRRVGDGGDRRGDLERAHALQEEVFGHSVGGIDHVESLLDATPEAVSFWIAEVDGDVVCAGRINIVEGTDVAGIWGGATHPEFRRRGIYRALTAARARWALERGVRYLHSDSTEGSRPILERSGLRAVTTTTPYIATKR